MTFASYRVWALLVKELAELRRNRIALLPVLILAVVTIVLPFLIALVVPRLMGEPLSSPAMFTSNS